MKEKRGRKRKGKREIVCVRERERNGKREIESM